MNRDTIISGIIEKTLSEGYVKDVLTYDVGKHHPRPGQQYRFNNKKRGYGKPMGRHKPKSFYPKARKGGSVKTSSAARTGPKPSKGKTSFGKKAAVTAAVVAAPYVIHKAHKALRTRMGVERMLRKADKKPKDKKKLKEAIVEMRLGRPFVLASNRRISFKRKHLGWPVIGNDRGETRTREMKTRGMMRVIEGMDREALIKAVVEVMDDRYSSGVFARGANEAKRQALIAKARKLRNTRLKKLRSKS